MLFYIVWSPPYKAKSFSRSLSAEKVDNKTQIEQYLSHKQSVLFYGPSRNRFSALFTIESLLLQKQFFRQDSFEKFDMAKRISNRKFSEIDTSVPLQSVTEESNLGYKPLIQDEDEIPTSHHRLRFFHWDLKSALSDRLTETRDDRSPDADGT